MTCRAAVAMSPAPAHAINLGTWDDATQSALCRDCALRLPIDAWTVGPCVPKDGVRLRDVFSTSEGLADWQRRFRAQPVVWVTEYYDRDSQTWEPAEYYETEAAAQEEVEWAKRQTPARAPKIRKYHLHSLQLAQERWRRIPTSPLTPEPPAVTAPRRTSAEAAAGSHPYEAIP